MIAVRMLLKSWAMPPASWPMPPFSAPAATAFQQESIRLRPLPLSDVPHDIENQGRLVLFSRDRIAEVIGRKIIALPSSETGKPPSQPAVSLFTCRTSALNPATRPGCSRTTSVSIVIDNNHRILFQEKQRFIELKRPCAAAVWIKLCIGPHALGNIGGCPVIRVGFPADPNHGPAPEQAIAS
jgi:hypothetical protein